MTAQPFSAVFSNNITLNFPELYDFIIKNYYSSQKFKKNDIISLPDQASVYYIKSGSVKSFMCDDSGVERLIYIMLDDTITVRSINEYFVKTLIANDANTELLAIRRRQVLEFIAQNPEFIDKWESITLTRYGILLQKILLESHCSSKYKVYMFILQMATRYGIPSKNNPNEVSIEGLPSITDIASITGVHRSNATTYINELRDQHIFEKKGSALTITDMALFQRIVTALDENNCSHTY